MVSLIICSRDAIKSNILIDSISKLNPGFKFEPIIVDNSEAKFSSISLAYNYGASLATGDIFWFLHEDVEVLTKDCLKVLEDYFNNYPDFGVLGIAGSIFKTASLSSWSQPVYKEVEPKRMNIVQQYKHSSIKTLKYETNPNNEHISEVVAIDGVFIAIQKSVFLKVSFNESILGFHGYDLDYSLSCNAVTKVGIIYDIEIIHYSEGYHDKSYFDSYLIVHQNYKHLLPLLVEKNGLSLKHLKYAEYKALQLLIIELYRVEKIWELKFIKHIAKNIFKLLFR